MLYLLAAVGAITVGVLLWKAFGVRPAEVAQRPRHVIAPDDDPEFLRGLDKFREKPDGEDKPPA